VESKNLKKKLTLHIKGGKEKMRAFLPKGVDQDTTWSPPSTCSASELEKDDLSNTQKGKAKSYKRSEKKEKGKGNLIDQTGEDKGNT